MKKQKLLLVMMILFVGLILSACTVKLYTITFDSDGGNVIEFQEIEENGYVTQPSNPVKLGYNFVGWLYDGNTYDFTSKVKSNMDLLASWEEKETYIVSYSTLGGTPLADQLVYENENALKPAQPTRTDFTFIEWQYNGVTYDFSMPLTKNIILTAVWQEILYNQYIVTFETYGGTTIANQIVREDQLVTKPSDPVLVNNTFLGWQVDGEDYYFDTLLTSNITIKAVWEEITYDEKTYEVTSVTEYNNIVSSLTPGDTVIFKDGTYSGTSLARIPDTVVGTQTQRITIKAQTIGGVIINSTVNWQIHGDYITISGFTFKDGYPKSSSGALVIYGDNVRLTNITMDAFDNPGSALDSYATGTKTGYVSVQDGAMFAEIDHCTFINKTAQGCLLLVDKNTYAGETYAHIHDNYFGNFTNPANHSNELETIRVGISSMSQTDSYTVIENNIFEDISSETELISIKSCKNVIRNNLILNCASAITLRHGNSNLVENNIILSNGIEDSNGIRVFDSYHVIRNNYISGIAENSSTFYGGLVIHNGNNEVGKEGNSLSGQWTASYILVENNSFVNNATNICLGDSRYEVAPGNLTFKNNLIYTSSGNAIRQYDSLNETNSQKSHIATDVTYSNEYYFANALGLVSTLIPDGINFSTQLANANLTELTNGLFECDYAGASNLEFVDKDEAQVQDDITQAVSLTQADYYANFEDWPFKSIYVDLPEPDEMFADYDMTTTLEDNLSDWKNTTYTNTTFDAKSVMLIQGGSDSTSASIEVGSYSGYVAISFDVYFSNISIAKAGIKLYSGGTSSSNEVARIKIEDSYLKYQITTGELSDGTLKTEYTKYTNLQQQTWHNIQIVFVTQVDDVSMKANIYVDGVLQNDDITTCLRSAEEITHIGFFTDSGTNNYQFYVNNLAIVSKETGF